jgi:hypothetical protein
MGAVPEIIKIFQKGSARAKKHCAAAIQNLLAEPSNKDTILQSGVKRYLRSLAKDTDAEYADAALAALRILARV